MSLRLQPRKLARACARLRSNGVQYSKGHFPLHCGLPCSSQIGGERYCVACKAAAKPWSPKEGRLVLADGTVMKGRTFGASGTKVAEVVFNTSLSGYQEIMTDPSYRDQMVCFTCPHIGNVGINEGATSMFIRVQACLHCIIGCWIIRCSRIVHFSACAVHITRLHKRDYMQFRCSGPIRPGIHTYIQPCMMGDFM
jgi:hypothetical protein